MKTNVFIDTNLFVYTCDVSDKKRQKAATQFLEEISTTSKVFISSQVLAETFSALTKKLHVTSHDARSFVNSLAKHSTVALTSTLVIEGMDYHLLHQISIWDGIILAAAKAAACSILYSEDFNHGQILSGVQIINPFELE